MTTIGTMIATARHEAGLSLGALGKALALSVPYLHDVEHDRRRLSVIRWVPLSVALPSLDLLAMAEASIEAGPIEIDARTLSVAQRKDLAGAVVASAIMVAKRAKPGPRKGKA